MSSLVRFARRMPQRLHYIVRQRPWGSLAGSGSVVLLVLLANALYITGLRNQNAISWTSQIASASMHSFPAIDPNVGFITQALGHQAALDLLHFHLPWWNPFEGIGAPLAGEMQSGALSPFVLLFALPGGLLWFHLALELVAGISTYLLIRRWVSSDLAAIAGGVAFGLNGTFAWIGNAALNPVAFLPLALLGVEFIVTSASAKRWGWTVLAIATALSLYAGFPEVAFLDGLFVLLYGITRSFSLARSARLTCWLHMVIGFATGGVLSLPLVVAFRDFLQVADVGVHTHAGDVVLSSPTWAMFFDPYVFGQIFGAPRASAYWSGVGGFFGMCTIALALFALGGRRLRGVRLFLGGWTVLALLGSFNQFHLLVLWDVVPFVNKIVLGRYIIASCEMAVVLLAAFGFDDVLRRQRSVGAWHLALGGATTLLLGMVLYASSIPLGGPLSRTTHAMIIVGRCLPFAFLALTWILGSRARQRTAVALLALVVSGEAVWNVAITEYLAPSAVGVAYGPLGYLEQHLGQARFVTVGPITPNWGTYFGLSELSVHDLPFPKMFETLANTSIPLGIHNPGWTYSNYEGTGGALLFEASIAAHEAQFEDAGVKYLVNYSAWPMSTSLAHANLTLVYHGQGYDIWQFPTTAPLFTAAGCTTSHASLNAVTVTCTQPSTLVRRELSMPGWTAAVNGAGVHLDLRQPYQRVTLPAGTSLVTFSFTPPGELFAEGAFVFAVASLVYVQWAMRIRRRTPPPTRVE